MAFGWALRQLSELSGRLGPPVNWGLFGFFAFRVSGLDAGVLLWRFFCECIEFSLGCPVVPLFRFGGGLGSLFNTF